MYRTKGSIDVRLYSETPQGDFDLELTTELSYFGDILPEVGDTLLLDVDFMARQFVVTRRCFVTEFSLPNGWALIVRRVEENSRTAAFTENWLDDSKWLATLHEEEPESASHVETVDDLDRSNRDPAYWTFERKELLRQEREARLAALKAAEESTKD